MIHKLMKFAIVLMLLLSTHNMIFAQNFYEDYQTHLVSGDKRSNFTVSEKLKWAKNSVAMLKKLFTCVERERNISMLSCDTLYILNYSGYYRGEFSRLIWNNNNSCYYEGNFARGRVHEAKVLHIENQSDASRRLLKVAPELKKIVEQVDTVGYDGYVKKNDLPENMIVSFTVAIKKGMHWVFISSKAFATSSRIDG